MESNKSTNEPTYQTERVTDGENELRVVGGGGKVGKGRDKLEDWDRQITHYT